MPVTWKTFKKHQNKWRTATSTIDSLLEGAEEPEHYFVTKAAKFDTTDFLEKNRSKIGLKKGKKKGFNLAQLYVDVGWDLVFTASRWCDETQRYMFQNHKWQNRTGDAEMSVDAKIAGMKDDKLEVYLYHGVHYGKYLEYSHLEPFPIAGDVSIIPETMQIMSPKLIINLQYVIESR